MDIYQPVKNKPFDEQIRNPKKNFADISRKEKARSGEDKVAFPLMNFHILSVSRSDCGYKINHSSKCG